MRQDDAQFGTGQADVADETTLQDSRAGLFVDINRGSFVGGENPGGEPVIKGFPRFGVPVTVGAGKDQTHHVVGMSIEQSSHIGFSDEVVRRGSHLGQIVDREPYAVKRA